MYTYSIKSGINTFPKFQSNFIGLQSLRKMSFNTVKLASITNLSMEFLDKFPIIDSKLGKHKIYLIGEYHDDLSAVALSLKLTLEAAQNNIAYFHEGVPKEDPYQELYISNFSHKPMLSGLSIKNFDLEDIGSNYGLENILFFVPHYLATYYRELSLGNEKMIDITLSDLLHITELHGPLKELSLKIEKLGTGFFSSFLHSFYNQSDNDANNSNELRKIKPMVQSIQQVVESNIFQNGLITKDQYHVVKNKVGKHDIKKWTLLVKNLLMQVCMDLRNKGLLTPELDSSFQELISNPKNDLVYHQWRKLASRARDEIFVNRLCEIVPQQPPDLDIVTSLGIYHIAEVAELLEQADRKTLPKTIMPSPFLCHLNKYVKE